MVSIALESYRQYGNNDSTAVVWPKQRAGPKKRSGDILVPIFMVTYPERKFCLFTQTMMLKGSAKQALLGTAGIVAVALLASVRQALPFLRYIVN